MGKNLLKKEEILLLTTVLLTGSLIACPGPWSDKSTDDAVWKEFRSYNNVSYLYVGRPLRTWSEAEEACNKEGSGAMLVTPKEGATSSSSGRWSELLKDLQEQFGERPVQGPWTSVRYRNGSWQTGDGDAVNSTMWVMAPLPIKSSSDSGDGTDPDAGRCAFLFLYSPPLPGVLGPGDPPAGLLDGACYQHRATLCERIDS